MDIDCLFLLSTAALLECVKIVLHQSLPPSPVVPYSFAHSGLHCLAHVIETSSLFLEISWRRQESGFRATQAQVRGPMNRIFTTSLGEFVPQSITGALEPVSLKAIVVGAKVDGARDGVVDGVDEGDTVGL